VSDQGLGVGRHAEQAGVLVHGQELPACHRELLLRRQVARERAKGESVRHLARILGVSKATIGRIPAAEP
jgi:hypothetical protein